MRFALWLLRKITLTARFFRRLPPGETENINREQKVTYNRESVKA